MSLIDKIKDKYKLNLRKKDEDAEIEELTGATDAGNIDFVEDVPETKTLRKKRIMMVIGAVVVFIVGTILSKTFFDKPVNTQQEKPLSTAAKSQSPVSAIPDKYSDIAKYQEQAKQNKDDIRAKSESSLNTKPSTTTTKQNQLASSNSDVKASTQPQQTAAVVRPVTVSSSASNKEAQKANEEAMARHNAMVNSSLAFDIASDIAQGNPINNPNNNSPQQAFYANTTNTNDFGTYALNAGTIIPATLLTGITSDVPGGDVVAQVRQDVYDSLTGTHLLIPQGSRLIGTSGAAKSRGNKRMEVIFTRIILPNNVSLALPQQRAIDGVGYPGVEDEYTEHKGSAYSSAFMAAILGAVAQSATGDTSGDDTRSPGQEAVSGAVAEILRTGEKFVDRELEKQPTITINPGFQFSVFINQDILIGEYLDY